METNIMNGLLEIVRQGGTLAVWAIVAYCAMQVLKIAVTGGILWGIICTISNNLMRYLDNKLKFKETQVSIISSQVSDKLASILEEFQKSLESTLGDLTAKLETLNTKLKQSAEK